MPNQININDVAGDLNKLNAELVKTTNELKDMLVIAEKINLELGNSKGVKEFNKILTESQKEQIATQKLMKQAVLDNEAIIRAKIKTQQIANTETTKAAKAAEKESSAWEKLNKQHKEALKNARDLGAQYGKNSQQFKDAANKANELNTKMNGLNGELGGSNPLGVAKYFQAIMKGAGVMGLAVGASQLLSAGFDKLKTSSQAFGDAFEEKKQGVNFQINKFFSMLGTGDFSNFIQNMKDAGQAGRDYAKAIDEQFEGGLSLTIKEAESRLKIAELKTKQARAKTKSEQDEFGRQILAEEERITEARLVEASKVYENERDNILKLQGIREAEFINFISNFRAESGVRESLAKKTEDLENRIKKIFGTTAESRTLQRDMLTQKFEESLTDEERIYRDFNNRYQGLTDENIQKTAESYARFNDIKAQKLEESLSTENKLASDGRSEAIKGIELEKVEYISANIEKEKTLEQLLDEFDKASDTSILKQIKAEEDKNKTLEEERKKFVEDSINDYDQWEKDESDRIKRLTDQYQEYFSQLGTFGNVLFDLGKSQRDSELADIESKYDKQITAAEGNSELQKSLGLELERERKRIAREEAVANRNQAMFDIAVNTASNIVKVFPNVAAMIAAGILGTLQEAVVMSRPLPGYFKGTENAPAGWGWLAEQGRELVKMPDGSSFIQEKPTLYNFKGGEKVKTHEATERLINEEVNGKHDNAPKMVQNVSVNFNKQGLIVISEDSKNYTKYVNDKVRH